ncbi:MAG TPA: trypsin-like peptidase domain-containing protein, partial [Tepidisphaeraceae bacterium]|nr:trypsin-like peptidase domain-containing protein [Tepidisphaeraceae bacterium]
MKPLKKSVATVVIATASAVAGFTGYGLVQDVQFARAEQQVQATRQQLQSVEDLSSVFREVGKAVDPSVVNIQVKKKVDNVSMRRSIPDELRRFFDRDGDGEPDINPHNEEEGDGGGMLPRLQQGIGSGVIIEAADGKAYVVTNNHVAGGASDLEVSLADGRTISGADAKVIGTDPKTDLAVVELNVDRVIAAKWGDSDTLQRGDWVLAFGSPLEYTGTMTHGIVSALNRQSNTRGGFGILGPGGYENFIQTDCPINPGNSGGPLVNVRGEVVGINTAIASRTGGFQGIGFAIPSNLVKPIYQSLRTEGRVTRGWLGIEIVDVARATERAKWVGFTGDTGVLVMGIRRGTPAAGKLQTGDVITTLNGKPVATTQELRNTIAFVPPGKAVTLGVVRNGKQQDVEVKVGEQPEDVMASARGSGRGDQAAPRTAESMGMRLSDATGEQLEKLGLTDAAPDSGAIVTQVSPRSPAAAAGVQPGDLITR